MSAALVWPKRPRFCRTGAMLLLLGAAGACAGPPRLAAVPAAITERAQPLGIPNSRFWADTGGPAMVREAKAALAREWAANPHDALAPATYLGISGGSDNGAFGAEMLVGWTEAGTRPEFKLVAGISTGALIAPFAFLGASYDRQLRAVYTTIGPTDVYEERWLPRAVLSDALAGTDPLFDLISRYCEQNAGRHRARVSTRPTSADRHNRSRRAAARDLEHRSDRR